MNPLLSVREILDKSRQSRHNETFLIYLHHALMKEYGWIPWEEFKQLPIPMVLGLLEVINEQREREQREMEKASRGVRHGR